MIRGFWHDCAKKNFSTSKKNFAPPKKFVNWRYCLERKSVYDWVSACRGLVVEGTRGRGRSRKTWEQCVRDDMKLLGLHPEWAVFRDMWRDLIWGKRLTLA